MAGVYFNRLLLGTITYDAIPSRYQQDVRKKCREHVRIGRMPVTQYEMLLKEEYNPDED